MERRQPLLMGMFVVIAVCLVGMNVYLLGLNRALVRERDSVARELQRRAELQVGEKVPPLEAYDTDGKSVRVSYDGPETATLLLVFAPDCPACERAWSPWKKMITELRSRNIRIVGVNLSRSQTRQSKLDYAARHDLGELPFLTASDASVFAAYRFGITPQVILVGKGGTVLGALTGPKSEADNTSTWAVSALQRGFVAASIGSN